MKRLFRILHWQARCRYWRKQAEAAKREVARLQLSLLAERYRNLTREDMFVSASVMGARGMYGVAPRGGPALVEPSQPKVPAVDPYQLSGADLMEFETFWKPDAEAAGISLVVAKQKFIQEVVIPRRAPLQDDPFSRAN